MKKLSLLCLILTVILILSSCAVRAENDDLSELTSDLSESVSDEDAYNIEEAQETDDKSPEKTEEIITSLDNVNPEAPEVSAEMNPDNGSHDSLKISPESDDSADLPQLAAVESINLSIDKAQIVKGDTVKPSVTVLPENADDLLYTLVSDNENVLREINGQWTAVGGGTANLTAVSSNGISVTLPVTVVVSAENISLDFNDKIMNRGETLTLNPIFYPSDTSDKNVTYTSDNSNAVTVSADGNIYASGAGIATVTCTASNGAQTKCTITVVIPVESISVRSSENKLKKGSLFEITVEIYPSDATDKSFSVSSSDENILKKSGDRWLAYGAGTAKITAAASNGITGSAEISVIVEVEAIQFNDSKKTINRYDRVKLNPTVYPGDATDKTLTYRTDNPNVVTVSDDGTVYAVGAGTATVTCRASNGIETSCEITVEVPVVAIYVELERLRYKIGETAGFNVRIYPEDATDKSCNVSVIGSAGALSGNNGVTCVSGGSVIITATASNGVSGTKEIEIVDLDAYAAEVIRLTNIERANYSMSALSGSNSLLKSASAIRADETIVKYSHTRPDGSDCFTAVDQIGLTYRACGENIAYGYETPEDVVKGWMNSEGHKENILYDIFTYIGVTIQMDSKGTLYWVQLFIG